MSETKKRERKEKRRLNSIEKAKKKEQVGKDRNEDQRSEYKKKSAIFSKTRKKNKKKRKQLCKGKQCNACELQKNNYPTRQLLRKTLFTNCGSCHSILSDFIQNSKLL